MKRVGRRHRRQLPDYRASTQHETWRSFLKDRALVCQVLVFFLALIVAGHCGNESRKERLACIAAGGREVRDGAGKNPYCVPPADSAADTTAVAPLRPW